MAVLHVKSATSNANLNTVGTKDDDTDPYGLQAAFDNVAAGDEIRIWADGTYTPSVQVDIDTASGSSSNFITVQGVNSSGTLDGTLPVIQASAAIGAVFAMGSAINHYRFLNLHLNGNSNATDAFRSTATNNDQLDFMFCRFSGATNDGLVHRSDAVNIVQCEADNNGAVGIEVEFRGAAGRTKIIGCSIHDNGDDGVFVDSRSQVLDCYIYDNAGIGLVGDTESDGLIIRGNTIYGNTGGGASFADLIGCHITNNTFVDNGGYGLDLNSASLLNAYIDFNHFHGNTSGPAFNSGAITSGNINTSGIGTNNVSGDPLFADPANGDFTPGAGSPLLNAGIDVTDL